MTGERPRIEPPPMHVVWAAAEAALAEDRAREDVTTLATVRAEITGKATFLAKEPGVVAGLVVAEAVFNALDPTLRFEARLREGDRFARRATLAVVHGSVRSVLQAERVALNFLQRLSGTATMTHAFVEQTKGTHAVILDTRKTTPGLRALEKYAVRCGGGTNHRADLAVMAMIKDNHREALAREGLSLADGVAAIRAYSAEHHGGVAVLVEVEIDALDELEAALAAQPEWILLDNMGVETMAEAVERTAGRAKLEASGGITLESVGRVARTGVDAISVGALTHSAPALDISLELSF
ncbi:MAG: carboxylating nicotinate-nucleotide diphosphorylase [Tepidiformaceae bacterium]